MKQELGSYFIVIRPTRGKGKVSVKQSFSSHKASTTNRLVHQCKLISNANQVQATMLQPLLSVYCYILQASTGQYYTGITKDIDKRLLQHNAGATKSTQKLKGWHIVHLQILPTRKQARELEIKIKARGAKRYIYSYNKQQQQANAKTTSDTNTKSNKTKGKPNQSNNKPPATVQASQTNQIVINKGKL